MTIVQKPADVKSQRISQWVYLTELRLTRKATYHKRWLEDARSLQ